MSEPLITKYRPKALDEIIGHAEVCAALERAITGEAPPHAYLLTGITGIGKTTIARIIGEMLKCEVLEVDAASNSGVEDARRLVELSGHRALSGAGQRMLIIDECHALSRAAWQPLLKMLEEPPEHLFVSLCTTEANKVPATIKSRCYPVQLRGLRDNEISDLLSVVCDAEEWKLNDEVYQLILRGAEGSARAALTMLEAVHDVDTVEEAMRVISLLEANDTLLDLSRALLSGDRRNPQARWGVIKPLLARIADDEIETAAIAVGRYMASAMVKAETPAQAERAWQILDMLVAPTESWDRKAIFYAAIGRVVFGAEL